LSGYGCLRLGEGRFGKQGGGSGQADKSGKHGGQASQPAPAKAIAAQVDERQAEFRAMRRLGTVRPYADILKASR